MQYAETDVESAELIDLSAQLVQTHGDEEMSRSMAEMQAADQFFACTVCRITVDIFGRIVRSSINNTLSEELSKKAFSYLCSSLRIQTPDVCMGLFDLNWHILYYVFKNSKSDPRTICGALPISFCQVKQLEFNYRLTIDSGKGPLEAAKSEIPQKTANDLSILHLTDIHNDPEYLEGSEANCQEPMCCRGSSTPKLKWTNESKAGYWGDYRNCDVPLYMVENAFDHIQRTHKKIDYIYHTGDIVPHNIWSTTSEGVKAVISEINGLIEKKFPNIPVFPCLGNHEAHPVNV